MQPFRFAYANSVSEAIDMGSTGASRFLAGGTTLVDLMKSGPENPDLVVDINSVQDLDDVKFDADTEKITLGALTRMSAAAASGDVRQHCPAISQSLLLAASGQIRNMASLAGNIVQRTRCVYFRDRSFPCNKREPGTGCSAITGENRNLAVLGVSSSCIANYPGDFAVALAALDARIYVQGPNGARSLAAAEFHVLPGETPHIETVLAPGDLITHIEVPVNAVSRCSHYLKIRDRSSYEFASVSVAAGIDLAEDGTIRDLKLALGGLATRPWRAYSLEDALRGKAATDRVALEHAIDTVLREAKPQTGNGYKVQQARVAIARVLHTLVTNAATQNRG